jgi:glutathione S-transferase
MLRVLGRTGSINVRKVLWTCTELGIPYEREDWGSGFRSTRDPEFLALNPKGLVPVLVDDDLVLTESNTIIRYLAMKYGAEQLYPVELARRAKVDEWLDWQATELNRSWGYAVQAILRKNPPNPDPALIKASMTEWHQQLLFAERQLVGRTDWLLGKDFTLADIVIALSVNRWVRLPHEKPALPNIEAYFERVLRRSGSQEFIGPQTD